MHHILRIACLTLVNPQFILPLPMELKKITTKVIPSHIFFKISSNYIIFQVYAYM
jgi:hypothetical protein